jgi:Zn-dependent peptidase ImmA (M78 family)
VIVVNPKDSPYGRIFTVVHELVHIALGKSVVQNMELRQVRPPDNPTEVFCNEVAAGVLVPKDELSEEVNLHTLETDLPQISKYFRVSPEVIMRRLLTLDRISLKDYRAYRNSLLEKYKESSPTGGGAPYHHRLLNAAGEHFARTAFTAYYEEKITLADLAAAFSNCDTKHLFEIESVIFA